MRDAARELAIDEIAARRGMGRQLARTELDADVGLGSAADGDTKGFLKPSSGDDGTNEEPDPQRNGGHRPPPVDDLAGSCPEVSGGAQQEEHPHDDPGHGPRECPQAGVAADETNGKPSGSSGTTNAITM